MSTLASSPPRERIALDQVFTSLSHPIRRRILTTLAKHYPRTEDEFYPPELQPGDKELKSFKNKLHHNHLPHLEDAGFIEWDSESDAITRGPNFEAVEPLITLLNDHQEELPEDWPEPDE